MKLTTIRIPPEDAGFFPFHSSLSLAHGLLTQLKYKTCRKEELKGKKDVRNGVKHCQTVNIWRTTGAWRDWRRRKDKCERVTREIDLFMCCKSE